MDLVKKTFGRRPSESEYEPLTAPDQDDTLGDSVTFDTQYEEVPFSWLEYSIFTLLGMAMLWAWNMFLAAAPYFASRLQSNEWIQQNFQSMILSVATITNLTAMTVLANIQSSASYPWRINAALLLNVTVFSLLTASTVLFTDAAAGWYLAFLLSMVAASAWAAGLIQNGAFAFAGSFGRKEYMQALMAGQGVAGVLPPVAQVATVLLFPPGVEKEGSEGEVDATEDGVSAGNTSAFLYFLAAVVVSVASLIAFIPLTRRRNRIIESRMAEQLAESLTSIEEAERAARKVTSLWTLFRKLRWLSLGVCLVFTETMFFPVFTARILSLNQSSSDSLIFQPAAFIPLAFFFWNFGDLSGRMATVLPFSLSKRPIVLFFVILARAGWLPLYLLCNIDGRGAAVSSDFFYLCIVQLLFGLSNGWLGSSCMIASTEWVDDNEREAAGGFMGLCLVIGLALGSVLSFTVAKV